MLRIHNMRVNGHSAPLGLDDRTFRFSWALEGDEREAQVEAFRVLAATSANRLTEDEADVWDSGMQKGAALHADYDGPVLYGNRRFWWKTIVWLTDGRRLEADPARFDTGLFAWNWQARWIWRTRRVKANDFAYFRKELRIRGPVAWAKLFVSAHHTAQVFIDGERIGGFGIPAPTNPGKRKYYTAYDVTAYLKPGPVCLAAVSHYLGGGGQNYVNGLPGFRLQLEVTYKDGMQLTVKTDSSWEALKLSPHRIGTPYQQNRRISAVEDVDGRLLDPGWMRVGYDAAKCRMAQLAKIAPSAWKMKWQSVQEGAVEEWIAPRLCQLQEESAEAGETSGGEGGMLRQVFDVGKIVSGWPRVVLEGCPGETIQLRYSEAVDENGWVRHNVCNEKSETYYDQYTYRGDGVECWQPDMSYKAFRYVEVTGIREPLEPGRQLLVASAHTNADHLGSFRCSDELLNRMYDACMQTQKNNMLGQLVDCPHREQAQYLADSDLQAEALLYNFDARHLLEKVVSDFADGQLADGTFPFVYPSNVDDPAFNLQIPEWDLHFCTILWKTYYASGDERLLENYYEPARRMVDYFLGTIEKKTGLVPQGKGWHISDWPYPSVEHGKGPLTVQNIKLLQAVRIVAEMAALTGRAADARAYRRKAARLEGRIVAGLYDSGRRRFRDCLDSERTHQGVNALALLSGIVPEVDRDEVLRFVAESPWESRTVLSLPLLRVLFGEGRPDAAYRLLNRSEYPGWGYMIRQGATTMWEGWDDIESHSHAWNGYPARLLQEYVAGIQCASPGFADVRIQPYIPGDLTYTEAVVPTVRGPVHVRWERGSQRSGMTDVERGEATGNGTGVESEVAGNGKVTETASEVAGNGKVTGAVSEIKRRSAETAEAATDIEGRSISLTVTLPPTMNGRVVLRPPYAPVVRQVRESGTVVWDGDRYHPGVAGIKRCQATADGGIELDIGSGTYCFMFG